MSYTDEALKAKLSTLNETQDSIVSVSQWVMFHKRHADRIASYWATRLRDSPPPKRLNFIYLVNDIVQNARARKRSEFPDAFSPLMPEAVQTAYRSSTPDIQNKIRRVVEVWRTRSVFEVPIQDAIEARLDEVDQSKGTGGKKTLMGNSLFASASGTAMPKELESLAPLQTALSKASIATRGVVDTAQTEYTKMNDSQAAVPSPPVYAARLSGLIKSLSAAEAAVAANLKAREPLINELQRILDIHKTAIVDEERQQQELTIRREVTEAKKREVEDNIMRGLTTVKEDTTEADDQVVASASEGRRSESASGYDFSRPEVEELTPEPEDNEHIPTSGAGIDQGIPNNPAVAAALAGFGDSGTTRARPASSHGLNGTSAKRRKMSHDNDDQVPDLGEMGMDSPEPGYGAGGGVFNLLDNLHDDVDELLRQEGGGVV